MIKHYISELRLNGAHHYELAETYNEICRDQDELAKSFVDTYLKHMIKTKV